jgi:anti-sigma factor ChrR (cupin superfamily)
LNQVNKSAECAERELLEARALGSMAMAEQQRVDAHLEGCSSCREEFHSVQKVVAHLNAWPAAELQPSAALWTRLAKRIGAEGWVAAESELSLAPHWPDLDWQQPAPGIYCKTLSTDEERKRVSMLVRLDPGVDYPPHVHAGVEELHLLDGELWIDDRKLYPGDFNRAEPGTSDQRVWSETGCTCVLTTSLDDELR